MAFLLFFDEYDVWDARGLARLDTRWLVDDRGRQEAVEHVREDDMDPDEIAVFCVR
jgi:hypothetical protein